MVPRIELISAEDWRAVESLACEPVVSPTLPLIAALRVDENIALPRRLCGKAFQRGAEMAASAMLFRLNRQDLLRSQSVARLSQEDTLIVKCLAAMLSPIGRFVVHCGGHLPDAHREAEILELLFASFPERLSTVSLVAEDSVRSRYERLVTP